MISNEECEKFMDDCVKVIKSHFPNSNIFWKENNFCYKTYEIYFNLAKDASECSNGIVRNDAMNWWFTIADSDLKNDNITIFLNRNYITRIADKNNPKEKYCVYGSIKVPYRKIKGNREQCITKLKKFIDKTAEIMFENAEVINQGIIKGLFKVQDKIA